LPGTKSDLLEFKAFIAVSLMNNGMVRMRNSPGSPGRLHFSKWILTHSVSKEVRLDGMKGHWLSKTKKKMHRGPSSRPVNVKHVSNVKSALVLFALNALNVITSVRNGQLPHMRTLSKLTVFFF
jgi:hypothetical protein